MKSLGWYLFWALLLANAVALVMLKLNVLLKATVIIALVVFAILAIVMFFANKAHQRVKKREEEANAKVAELQDQMTEVYSKERVDGTSV